MSLWSRLIQMGDGYFSFMKGQRCIKIVWIRQFGGCFSGPVDYSLSLKFKWLNFLNDWYKVILEQHLLFDTILEMWV